MPRSAGQADPRMRGMPVRRAAVAQASLGMDPGGHRARPMVRTDYLVAGDFLFAAAHTGWHLFFGYGPGGYGGTSPGTDAADGGGGAAVLLRAWLARGQTAALRVGHCGGPFNGATTIAVGGRVASAGLGGTGEPGFGEGGAGGLATGGDVNRNGGAGSGLTNPDGDYDTGDGVNTGRPGDGNVGGGFGSGAAFFEYVPGRTGGHGSGSATGSPPAPSAEPGGDGSIVVLGPVKRNF